MLPEECSWGNQVCEERFGHRRDLIEVGNFWKRPGPPFPNPSYLEDAGSDKWFSPKLVETDLINNQPGASGRHLRSQPLGTDRDIQYNSKGRTATGSKSVAAWPGDEGACHRWRKLNAGEPTEY